MWMNASAIRVRTVVLATMALIATRVPVSQDMVGFSARQVNVDCTFDSFLSSIYNIHFDDTKEYQNLPIALLV